MIIHSIADQFGFGTIQKAPVQISGGLLHQMYRVSTDTRDLAVKILNPEIMSRGEAYGNFIVSEQVAHQAKMSGIPAVCALAIDENSLIHIGDRYAMVFDWMEGRTLPELPVTPEIAETMGQTLARIHNARIDVGVAPSDPYAPISFDSKVIDYLDDDLRAIISESLKRYNASLSLLNTDLVMSHRDLDQKNVLWDTDNNPYLIDWESAGRTNPMVELVTMALNWGGIVSGHVDRDAFMGVIRGYSNLYPVDYTNMEAYLFATIVGPIEWLAYNISRSKNPEESEIATREIARTSAVIKSIFHDREKYLAWM